VGETLNTGSPNASAASAAASASRPSPIRNMQELESRLRAAMEETLFTQVAESAGHYHSLSIVHVFTPHLSCLM
jgi:hypothetical protein